MCDQNMNESSDPGSKNNDARLAEATKIDLRYNWLKALRSGEYTQGYGALFRNGGYCCLGVACVVNGFEFKLPTSGITGEAASLTINGFRAASFLPEALLTKLGLNSEVQIDLVFRNDTLHHSFAQIADYLQEVWRKEWIAALRSGQWKQGKRGLELRREDEVVGHCCLGVACKINDIALDYNAGVSDFGDTIFETLEVSNSNLFVPAKVAYILGIEGIEDDLVDMNDTEGQTFAAIADYLERTWFPGEVSNVREPDAEEIGSCNGTGASINS